MKIQAIFNLLFQLKHLPNLSIRKIYFLIPGVLLCTTAFSQQDSGGGFYMPERNGFCLSPDQQQHIERTLSEPRKRLMALGILKETDPDERAITSLSWPIDQNNGLDDYGIHSISNFFDHHPDFPDQTLDYNCGNRTYDLPSGYNHRGTDIFLWPFEWYKMENDQV